MYKNIYNFEDFLIAVEKEGRQRLALSLQKDYAPDFNYQGMFNSYSKMEKTIENINIIDVARKKRMIESTIEYDSSLDPRAVIFNYAKNNNWIILKMNPTSDNLEDVFRNLTLREEPNHE